jgi:hypothetical protein
MMSNRSAIARVASQIGSTLLDDNDQWVNRFQVRSTSSGSLYTIAQRRSDRTWGCSCNGWRHYRHCKHLTDVLGRLARVAAARDDQATAAVLESAKVAYLDLSSSKKVAAPKFKGRVLDLEG